MRHPFSELRPEYTDLLGRVQVTQEREAHGVAEHLRQHLVQYDHVGDRTHVPPALLAALHQRESSANFKTYLGNGEPLSRTTRLVPRGRGPFLGPNAWEAGAVDAINYDHLNDTTEAWSMPYVLWKGEAWNGFGPRNHGCHTGYLWSGTNIYKGGKYVADGKWDPDHWDTQLGIVPVMLALFEQEPSWVIPGSPLHLVKGLVTVPAPSIVPEGVGGGATGGTLWVQQTLNRLGFGPLLEDDSYGRRTREAVRAFQKSAGLRQDGLAGTTETIPALMRAIKRKETT